MFKIYVNSNLVLRELKMKTGWDNINNILRKYIYVKEKNNNNKHKIRMSVFFF